MNGRIKSLTNDEAWEGMHKSIIDGLPSLNMPITSSVPASPAHEQVSCCSALCDTKCAHCAQMCCAQLERLWDGHKTYK